MSNSDRKKSLIMTTTSNMKCRFFRVSWGMVTIDGTRIYCELWLNTSMMNLKIKFKIPKGMSYSYMATTKDCPFKDGQFVSYWIPKNVYFPIHFCGATVNELVEAVVEHLQLKFFEEPRKWLTKEPAAGTIEWCQWIKNPMHPENIRQRILKAYGVYQVYRSEIDCQLYTSRWHQDGIHDYPYSIYVGTRSECEAYIREHK